MATLQKNILPSLFNLPQDYQPVVANMYERRRYGFCDASIGGDVICGGAIYDIATRVVDAISKQHHRFINEDRPVTIEYLINLIEQYANEIDTQVDAADFICIYFEQMGLIPDFSSATYSFLLGNDQ